MKMRKFYVFLISFFLLCMVVFLTSFFFLDNQKHNNFSYIINFDDHDMSIVKIDKFITEDKLIYKSTSNMPLADIYKNSRTKIVYNRKYAIENCTIENYGNGATETISLDSRNGRIDYVAVGQSEFSFLNDINIRENTFIFSEDSPVTYIPILENYDFRRGKSQGFRAITQFSTFLPPIQRFVTLTSVRDEYIKIGSRKIKCECLLLKIRNYPQGTVWVSKSDKSLIKIEIPARKLNITRTFDNVKINAKDYSPTSDRYLNKEVSFNNGNVKLAGTLSLPKSDSRSPGVVLVWGERPSDRGYNGLFTSLANDLSNSGYAVLRFDKRGIGKSLGNFDATTDEDEINDVSAAITFLRGQKEVEPENIIVIGHAKGAFYALRAASIKENNVKAAALLSPLNALALLHSAKPDTIQKVGGRFKWNKEYIKMLTKSQDNVLTKIKNSKSKWTTILGKRCYLEKMRGQLTESPVNAEKNISIPILVVQGKEDDTTPLNLALLMDEDLSVDINKDRKVTYFGYLGHYLGKYVSDGNTVSHYEIDPAVSDNIIQWLGSIDNGLTNG